VIIELSGAAGMLVMGWLSDKMGGRRARLSALAMIPLLPAFLCLILSGSLLLSPRDINTPESLVERLQSGTNAVGQFVWRQIPEPSRRELTNAAANSKAQQFALAHALNAVLQSEIFFDPTRFAGVKLRQKTQELLAEKLEAAKLVYRNRLLLEDAFPTMIGQCRYTQVQLLWLNLVLFGIIGFFVYTPVTFSGVVALDLTSKKAQATAAGFVGMFGYVGGRVIQGIGLGWLAQHYGWDAGLYAIIGCIVLGIVLLAFLWNVRPRG
jgi:MFS family permease